MFACNGGFSVDGPGIVEISVDPLELEIETGPLGTTPVQFNATAHYAEGSVVPLPVVEWGVSNRSAGEIDDSGLFTPSSTNGGVTWITAELDGIIGRATVNVLYAEAIVLDESIDPEQFAGEPFSALTDSWLYPEDGVNIPRNTPSISFMWKDLGASAYRLRLTSATTDLSVYTTETRWNADSALWPSITSTNAGGSIEAELSAIVDGAYLAEKPIEVHVNRMDANGEIVYWSTSVGGFKAIPYGEESYDFLTQAQAGRCVACHVISNEGTMAFTYDGGNQSLGVKRLSDFSDIIPADTQYANFKTFSPDSDWLLGTFEGKFRVWDARTGTFMHEFTVAGGGTHPDWSPDGSQVVFSWTDGHAADWSWAGPGRLALMDHLGDGQFGTPTVLIDPGAGKKAYYPTWSPDGEWIAYNVSTGDAYDDPDAEVWVVSKDGQHNVRLDFANNEGQLTNSWPRWGPLPDDDVLWLTFASKRFYGDITAGNPQIWVSAFDPALAEADQDPSWPAFWLPNQDVTTSNHIPQWTQ